jgi:hypothetical protein
MKEKDNDKYYLVGSTDDINIRHINIFYIKNEDTLIRYTIDL